MGDQRVLVLEKENIVLKKINKKLNVRRVGGRARISELQRTLQAFQSSLSVIISFAIATVGRIEQVRTKRYKLTLPG